MKGLIVMCFYCKQLIELNQKRKKRQYCKECGMPFYDLDPPSFAKITI